MNFQELGLRAELLQAITEMGFTTPMPIQEQAIPALLKDGADFVGLAQTGTGKTGAFGLPLLHKLDVSRKAPQAVILCPTRELCLQIVQELRQFARHLKGFRIVAVYGGASISFQVGELRRGAQVVVATPGRMLDLMQRGAVVLTGVAYAVLDEADEMLDMGFQEDIDRILKALPADVHTWMFSATMSKGVAAIARRYLKNPVEVTIGTRNQGAENITHLCYTVHPSHRYASLKRIIDVTPDLFGLVFRRTRRDTQELAEMLARDGYPAEPLHGDLSQAQRDGVMGRFRRRQLRLLIATDVAARGIDVDDITHIIHYDLPDEIEVYTHRSGRTARAGKSGHSIVFVSPADKYRIGQMERRLRIRFTEQTVPDGAEICRRRLQEMAESMVRMETDEKTIAKWLPQVETVLAPLSREELVKRLVAKELEHHKGSHVSSQNLNAEASSAGGGRSAGAASGGGRPNGPMHAFEINAGRADGINEGAIVRLVCEHGALQSNQIGGIRMQDRSSLFEVSGEVAEQVRNGLHGALLDGRPVKIRDAEALPPRGHAAHFAAPQRGGPRRPPRKPYQRFRVHGRQ
ncbi:MAG: DEAD/DEAH box helicase [Kiritimatiellae bacterium]|nr:DEAD/DEAH box helicase [Kiritimatiellia bacterium]